MTRCFGVFKVALMTLLLAPALIADAQGRAVTVSGGGHGSGFGLIYNDPTTHDVLGPADLDLQFAIHATLFDDGSARGQLELRWQGPIAQVFGLDWFHSKGQVTDGWINPDGTVSFRGTAIEKDFARGQGVTAILPSEPFIVTVRPGRPSSFRLQYCDIVPFTVFVANGGVYLH